MSRKPRSRQRKILITDDVVELFRKAQTAWFSWSGSHGNSKERTKELRNTTVADDEEFFNRKVTNSRHGFSLEKLCRNHPDAVASYLADYGVGAEEIATYILDTGTPLKMQ